ncbi:peptidase M24, structural domain-containing protein [Zychaea mexicana]|uniref:peptidase M24, structural domain-containing protein n=1 Tax=Zychaea mexicana TaxID=64656 RepID=UPI0022FE6642|nr:peptidase M24, structural domain-containing protein [Zychaea mexicana]KAI9497466.1 peptidase M24, structural domain-containing protein [Zychaea mexicana]
MPPIFSSDRLPTKEHYFKIKRLLNPDKNSRGIIYHRGADIELRDDTDVELDFRNESNFVYLTGVEEAGFHVVIDLFTDLVYLIPPTVPDNEVLWSGAPDNAAALLQKYDADAIVSEADLPGLLMQIDPNVIHILDTTDTTALCEAGVDFDRLEFTALKIAMHEARLTKFPWEIELVRYACHISSHAHIALMQHVKPRQMERELEARFRWECARNGMHRQCYLPIVASGPRAATLHYTKNNQIIPSGPHSLVLVDAGGERRCYGSDVTRTFPSSGTFSPEAKTIYEIVLKAQEAVLEKLKPGVLWTDMHQLVVRILSHELVRIGILVNADPEELVEMGVIRAFYFHGTGHSVGLDVHDVGGRGAGILSCNSSAKNGKSSTSSSVSKQQLLTKPLEEHMVITVEPGLYFNETSLAMWTKVPYLRKYFNMDRIEQYRPVGGVRIEDTVLITSDGIENLTIAPKTVKDIEAVMALDRQH